MNPVGQGIEFVLWAFLMLLLTRLVADWVQMFARAWTPRGAALVVLEGVYTATDPPVKALRRLVPPLRLGGVALDVSFLLVLVVVFILRAANQAVWTR